jgi:two-component system OmpR family sensor kinase
MSITDIKEHQDFSVNSIEWEIKYIIDEFQELIVEKNVEIKHIQSKDFTVNCDKEYLYIFLSNIIKNAIKFSHNWGVINISYMDNKCIIQDFWEWIKKENIEKIFDRFFQEQQSRNSEGFWIWLALVSKIAHIYKWKISIESEKWEWTKFIINF